MLKVVDEHIEGDRLAEDLALAAADERKGHRSVIALDRWEDVDGGPIAERLRVGAHGGAVAAARGDDQEGENARFHLAHGFLDVGCSHLARPGGPSGAANPRWDVG